jgi:hypothetical protein
MFPNVECRIVQWISFDSTNRHIQYPNEQTTVATVNITASTQLYQTMILPQPSDDGPRYKYLTYDQLPLLFPSLYFGTSSSSLCSNHCASTLSSTFKYDTLVWVLVSKGRVKECDTGSRGPVELFQRARVLQVLCESNETCTISQGHSLSQEDKSHQDRVLVQYPLGSTYRVRSSFLIPGANY